jgi:hypothetical protein
MRHSIPEQLKEAKKRLDSGEEKVSIALGPPSEQPPKQVQMAHIRGRLAPVDAALGQVDMTWTPEDILGFDLCLSSVLDAHFLVSGRWDTIVPQPPFALDLRIPFLEGIPPTTLADAIIDDPEVFTEFRRTIRSGLTEALNAKGSESFDREIKRIQEQIIDAGVDRLDRMWKAVKTMRAARFGAYSASALGLQIGLYFVSSPAQIVGLFSTLAVNFFVELEKRICERKQLKDEPMYFIWKIGKSRKRK